MAYFYKTGIDITNDKQMFNFLKRHYQHNHPDAYHKICWTIANNVKLHQMNLSGDWCVAHHLLLDGGYYNIQYRLREWDYAHQGYEVRFGGRSDGYLILCNANNSESVLPDELLECEDYEEYKRWCRTFVGSVRANREELVYYTKLVQDFDKLCDELRDFCDELSQQVFEVVTMQRVIDEFNDDYADDLEFLDFNILRMDNGGAVNVSEIFMLKSLADAFIRICLSHCQDYGYDLDWHNNESVYIKRV